MNRISRRSVLLAGAALSATLLPTNAAWAQSTPAWPKAPAAGQKGSATNPINLGSNWTVGFTPAYSIPEIAAKNGWTVKVIDFPSSAQRATALAQGSIDMAMLGWAAAIKMRTDGLPVVAIANSFSAGYAFVAKKNSGIKTIADLKGRSVAITIGSMNEMHLLSQLATAKVPASDVKIVQMNLTDMPLALGRGDIDVMVSDEPASSVALSAGLGELLKYPNDTSMGGINANVTTTESFIASNAAATAMVIRALADATDFLNSNPNKLIEIAKGIFKRDDAIVKTALTNIKLDYRIKTSEVAALADWQLQLKQIKSKPDMDKFINQTFLQQAGRA